MCKSICSESRLLVALISSSLNYTLCFALLVLISALLDKQPTSKVFFISLLSLVLFPSAIFENDC